MKPTSYAAIVSLTYGVVGTIYIVASTRFAGARATSVEDLMMTEAVKGSLFIVITSALLFVLTRVLFGRLAEAAAESVRTRQAFIRAQEQATAGIFAASIAHDLNNILMVIQYGVSELESAPDEPPDAKLVVDMADAVGRASRLARRLARSADPIDLEVAVRSLGELIGESVTLLERHRKARNVDVRLEVDEDLRAPVYPSLVRQLVTNLALNALEATSEGGAVLIRVVATEGWTVIEVHDDGPGFADPEHAMDEFFTTKENGTGLGLTSVEIAAAAHNGDVELDTSPLGGALVRVRIGSPAEQALTSKAAATNSRR